MQTIWKPIKDFNDYEVSNTGKVRSTFNGCIYELSGYPQSRGYIQVCLCVNGYIAPKLVHRLVAETFIENDSPEKNQVNHKDENKNNNNVNNLEWCTPGYNCNYGTKPKKMRDKKIMKVILRNIETNEFIIIDSKSETIAFLGCSWQNLANTTEWNKQLLKPGYENRNFNSVEEWKEAIQESKTIISKTDGKEYEPYIVESVLNKNGDVLYKYPRLHRIAEIEEEQQVVSPAEMVRAKLPKKQKNE